MTASSNVIANFNAYAEIYKDARPDQSGGGGGWFPDPGEHQVIITGMRMERSTFRTKDGQEFPSTLVTFSFQLVDDPGSVGDPREFEGASFNLPDNPSQASLQDNETAKNGTRIRLEINRLKGHLSTILGGPSKISENPARDLEEAQKAVSGGTMAVLLRAQHQTKGDRTYRKEFLIRAL